MAVCRTPTGDRNSHERSLLVLLLLPLLLLLLEVDHNSDMPHLLISATERLKSHSLVDITTRPDTGVQYTVHNGRVGLSDRGDQSSIYQYSYLHKLEDVSLKCLTGLKYRIFLQTLSTAATRKAT